MRLKDMLVSTDNVNIIGNMDIEVDGLNLCNRETMKKSIVSYATTERYAEIVERSGHIKVLMVSPELVEIYNHDIQKRDGCLIVSKQPEVDFYLLHEHLCKNTDFYESYDFTPRIGANCKIHPSAVIDAGVIIGRNVVIGAGTVVKRGTIIDDNTEIGCNSVIGSEGFQLITASGRMPMHITHVGKCHICHDVYIGDNTCICNSLFEGETYIGAGAKIDNLVHVAHNLYIGRNAVVTAHVILCGSSRIEDNAWIAPNVSILNRVTIGKGAKVGMGSVVTKDVAPFTVVYGNPAKPH